MCQYSLGTVVLGLCFLSQIAAYWLSLWPLKKPPWVVFPGWGKLPLLSVAKHLWGANGAWRKGSGPSWQRWPGCGAACRQEGKLLAKLRG